MYIHLLQMGIFKHGQIGSVVQFHVGVVSAIAFVTATLNPWMVGYVLIMGKKGWRQRIVTQMNALVNMTVKWSFYLIFSFQSAHNICHKWVYIIFRIFSFAKMCHNTRSRGDVEGKFMQIIFLALLNFSSTQSVFL